MIIPVVLIPITIHKKLDKYDVVNFLSQVTFVFLLFLGMQMYIKEVETKEM